jgi:hypothetical protein
MNLENLVILFELFTILKFAANCFNFRYGTNQTKMFLQIETQIKIVDDEHAYNFWNAMHDVLKAKLGKTLNFLKISRYNQNSNSRLRIDEVFDLET